VAWKAVWKGADVTVRPYPQDGDTQMQDSCLPLNLDYGGSMAIKDEEALCGADEPKEKRRKKKLKKGKVRK
jgi:hypothetical protein